jgi:hypothetical protein
MRPLLLAPLLAALACGGSGSNNQAPGDGAAGGEGGTVPTSCQLAPQAGCQADEQCSAFCDPDKLVIACRAEPTNAPALDQPCMNVPCARGSTCLAAAGMSAACKRLCTSSGDCPTGQACRNVTVTYGCAMTGPKSVVIQACI